MYQVIASKQFGKDYKKCQKRNLQIELLDEIIIAISENEPLAAKHKLHKLSGVYKNCWECTCNLIGSWCGRSMSEARQYTWFGREHIPTCSGNSLKVTVQ
jgi:mRNA interferase YafQ